MRGGRCSLFSTSKRDVDSRVNVVALESLLGPILVVAASVSISLMTAKPKKVTYLATNGGGLRFEGSDFIAASAIAA